MCSFCLDQLRSELLSALSGVFIFFFLSTLPGHFYQLNFSNVKLLQQLLSLPSSFT